MKNVRFRTAPIWLLHTVSYWSIIFCCLLQWRALGSRGTARRATWGTPASSSAPGAGTTSLYARYGKQQKSCFFYNGRAIKTGMTINNIYFFLGFPCFNFFECFKKNLFIHLFIYPYFCEIWQFFSSYTIVFFFWKCYKKNLVFSRK